MYATCSFSLYAPCTLPLCRYRLCDELGLYVVDEANVEAHGALPMGRFAMDLVMRQPCAPEVFFIGW